MITIIIGWIIGVVLSAFVGGSVRSSVQGFWGELAFLVIALGGITLCTVWAYLRILHKISH